MEMPGCSSNTAWPKSMSPECWVDWDFCNHTIATLRCTNRGCSTNVVISTWADEINLEMEKKLFVLNFWRSSSRRGVFGNAGLIANVLSVDKFVLARLGDSAEKIPGNRNIDSGLCGV